MKLTLDTVQKLGGFTGGPVLQNVKWLHDGEEVEAEVYVRRLSYHSVMADAKAIGSGGSIVAHRISSCICNEDGSPVFQVSDITGYNDEGEPIMTKRDGKPVERGAMSSALVDALFALINEVSGLGKKKGSESLNQKKSSGTSLSLTESAEKPSRKPSKRSATKSS